MKMSEHDAAYIQSDMLLLAIDDTSNCPLMIYGGGQKEEERGDVSEWVRAVNLIYRCLHCGLWTATEASPYMREWYAGYGLKNDYDFCKKLSVLCPFSAELELESENMQFWMGALLCNTDLGQSFVESFGVENLEGGICTLFIEALEDIFRKNGVPWEAGDLFNMKSRIG